MGALDWFLKEQKQEQEQNNNTTNTKIETVESISIKDKIDSIKTEKFNKFLEQIEVLKSISSISLADRYKAAMATSGISIDEINSNISEMKTTLKNESAQFEFELNNETGSYIADIEISIKEDEKRVETLQNEIKDINKAIEENKKQIEDLRLKCKGCW